ncbi:MAG TPA: hypothetical protein PLD43_12485, partial [Anaerolineae bacterium]|nr:hypothetical protein [Anaerolineae bacterium]
AKITRFNITTSFENRDQRVSSQRISKSANLQITCMAYVPRTSGRSQAVIFIINANLRESA